MKQNNEHVSLYFLYIKEVYMFFKNEEAYMNSLIL